MKNISRKWVVKFGSELLCVLERVKWEMSVNVTMKYWAHKCKTS
jgi:hypothetical protein